jgi:hypothetical protein
VTAPRMKQLSPTLKIRHAVSFANFAWDSLRLARGDPTVFDN